MAIRQEQIVLVGAALLLGYLAFTGESDVQRRSSRSKQVPEFESHRAPDLDPATARARSGEELDRDLFSPPTDTRPLPRLDFEAPPLEPLSMLRPAPAAGPSPALYGELLRSTRRVEAVEGLFVEADEEEVDESAEEEFATPDEFDESLMTVEERQARLASYKATYDWVDLGNLRFGWIRNKQRFGLPAREGEPIRFVEVDPATGADRFPGQEPFEFERERVEEFGFADTPENRIELERMQYDGTLTPGQYTSVLEFANRCLLARFETPRALEVAEELYRKAQALTTDDPAPTLGLAAVAEAGFDFETAFDIYRELEAGRMADDPRVLARLAHLEARFRLFDRAREHFERAERFGRTQWLVQWHYGNFLLERGEVAAAVEHLRAAEKFQPTQAEYKRVRATIRTDLARALVAAGELQEAAGLYRRALQADEGLQRAGAGLLEVAYLTGTEGELEVEGDEGAGFELLVAQGLRALEAGDHAAAREDLELAAASDPLRAYIPWRALSYLAEVTGNPAEALGYIDRAEENDPTDVWTLYQRGRILAQLDDLEGALESFSRALDRELDLPDALAQMGRLSLELGRHEAAERYLERATDLDPSLAEAFTLRGLVALHLERPELAREHFEQALVLAQDDPVAAIGQAWCAYMAGEPTEAKTLLREFEDSRRALGEEDPYRVHANAQIARIGDWEEKVVWTDRFERQELRNGWLTDEVTDTAITLRDGKVVIEGTFDKSGRTRLKRNYTSGDFVSLEVAMTVRGENTVRAGVFVALEQARGARTTDVITAETTLSRHGQDRTPQFRSMRRGKEDEPYVDSRVMPWADGQRVVLRLERVGESAKTGFRVSIDGVPLTERLPMPALGATTREIVVGVFAEGEPGRTVSLEVDDVEVIKRER